MTRWIALGPTGKTVTAYAMDGGTLINSATAEDEKSALAALDFEANQAIRIGDGTPAKLPAKLTPEDGQSLPGFEQASPPDIIGAWIRLWCTGFAADKPNWDGVICAISSGISHWIHISANEAVSCQSFLSPGLIDAFGGAFPPDAGALFDSLSRPERLASHLRQAQVSARTAAATGHLIGAELMAARPYWLGQSVVLISDEEEIAEGYATALEMQSVPHSTYQAQDLIPAGLTALGKSLELFE
ncbi:2-keto-3-deoxy-galactonokinase [Roseovarius albus]|uniref:2-keto-3-deoxy-galactonokinase n=1 Tax=Roseovarius albus TaxID=1247867 RepID=A0A1X6ZZW9_9RHOB|nr:2-dehydro-3-deoxygalactonokinase [Roseovarius albus]SLN66214.1 2-keto-3-deoxy-galactonokinase [Roseovarius albus]